MKKISLLLLLVTSVSFGAEQIVFWVENPEMVNAYYNVFTAIESIFSSGTYVNLLRLMFLVGGFFVFAGGIFGSNGEKALSGYIKYLLIGVALLTLVFYKGNTEVWVIAKDQGSYCSDIQGSAAPAGLIVPGKFPTILAYAFQFTNKLGMTMTDLAESAYTTSSMTNFDSQKMSQAGYMGALKGAMNLIAVDPSKVGLSEKNPVTGVARTSLDPAYDIGKAYRSMFTDCILIPFSAKGVEGSLAIAELKSTSDIHKYLDDRFSSTGTLAATTIGGIIPRDLSMTYQGEVYNCGTFYDNVIEPIYTSFYKESICGYGSIGAGAVSLITGAPSTNSDHSDFQEIAVQAGLVSELEGSLSSLGVGVSGVGYASGKTRAEFIQSSLASGVYMAEMLPYLQMTIRAILYAFFPFVFVIVLLPGGLKVLGTFFETIIWVELWSPTAAIINMFMMTNATNQFKDIYGGSGLTMLSSIDMLSTGSSIAGVAGYLYLSVPALTWLIMKGSAQMLGNITGAMGAGMAKNITTQAINEDKALVAKTQEASVRSGKELSMAEMQHYEAIQGGRMEGAKLGVQMNAGMDTMSDIEAMEETKKTKGYEFLSDASGLGAAGIGTLLAGNDTRTNLENLNTGAQALNITGNIKKTTKGAAKHKANVKTGTDIAESENTQSVESAKHTARNNLANKKGAGNAAKKFSQGELVQASKNQTEFNIRKNNAIDPSLGTNAGQNQNWDISEKATRNSFLKKNGYSPNDTGWSQYVKAAGGIGAAKAIAAIANKYYNGSLEEMGFANRADQGTIITDGGELVKIKMGTDKDKYGNTKLGKEIRDYDQLGQNFYNHQVRANFIKYATEGLSYVTGMNESTSKQFLERMGGAIKEGGEFSKTMNFKSVSKILAVGGVAAATAYVKASLSESTQGEATKIMDKVNQQYDKMSSSEKRALDNKSNAIVTTLATSANKAQEEANKSGDLKVKLENSKTRPKS